jgi:hypothetical protein
MAVEKSDAKVFRNGDLELHPLSGLFPPMARAEYAALKSDIEAHGQRVPIVIHEGAILDGAHRNRVCVEIGVEPMTVEFAGDDPVAFVLSSNLHRRHLTPSQQAMIVARAQDWAKALAHGGDRKTDQGATLHLDTAGKRAAESGVSLRTQKMADKVAKEAPELAKQVAHGAVSLPKAIKQITPAHTEPETPAHDRAPRVEPAGKPEVAPAPTQSGSSASLDEDAHGDFDPVAELVAAQKEIDELQEQVAALSAGDVAAKLKNEIRTRQGIERRLAQEMDTTQRLDRQLRWFGKRFEELRILLGVETNSRIVGAVRAALKSKVA